MTNADSKRALKFKVRSIFLYQQQFWLFHIVASFLRVLKKAANAQTQNWIVKCRRKDSYYVIITNKIRNKSIHDKNNSLPIYRYSSSLVLLRLIVHFTSFNQTRLEGSIEIGTTENPLVFLSRFLLECTSCITAKIFVADSKNEHTGGPRYSRVF